MKLHLLIFVFCTVLDLTMLLFILKRILYGFLLMLGVITLVFFLFTVLPSDPARMIMGQRTDIATEEAIRKEMGLDLPIGVQYLAYLNDLSPISKQKQKIKTPFLFESFQLPLYFIPFV